MPQPDSLGAEGVKSLRAVLFHARAFQRAGLSPSSHGNLSGHCFPTQKPGVASLAYHEIVSVEDRGRIESGLDSGGQSAVINRTREVRIRGWCDVRGYAVRGIVISGRHTNQGRVLEDWRIYKTRDRWDRQALVRNGDGPRHVIEVNGWHPLSDSNDEFVGEPALPPPELAKLGADEGLRPGQPVVSQNKPGLSVGIFALELKHRRVHRASRKVDEFLDVQVQVQYQQTIEAPRPRLYSAS